MIMQADLNDSVRIFSNVNETRIKEEVPLEALAFPGEIQ